VGSIAGAAIIITAVWFYIRRRKSSEPSSAGFVPFQQKGPDPAPAASYPPTYAGSEIRELESRSRPPELDSSEARSTHELP
jgi:hypothetical protein